MPTENRSSNTEMVSVPRDWLNSVALLQMPLDELQEQAVELLCEPCDDPAPQHHADPDGYPPCDYCGITPDYHPWHGSGMINGFENRHIHACDGCRGKLPSHPGQPHPEPIAWMVGTAFWWTKEEAERDAAATGKTITPIGPMFDTGEVDQLSQIIRNLNDERDGLGAEVGRLRAQLAELKKGLESQVVEGLRADTKWLRDELDKALLQLAERDALLRSIVADWEGPGHFPIHESIRKIRTALYSSAEPEAPQSEPEKPSRCTSCDNCKGFNTGHDSSQQLPYRISCDNCHKEARAADHAGLARAWNAVNQGG